MMRRHKALSSSISKRENNSSIDEQIEKTNKALEKISALIFEYALRTAFKEHVDARSH